MQEGKSWPGNTPSYPGPACYFFALHKTAKKTLSSSLTSQKESEVGSRQILGRVITHKFKLSQKKRRVFCFLCEKRSILEYFGGIIILHSRIPAFFFSHPIPGKLNYSRDELNNWTFFHFPFQHLVSTPTYEDRISPSCRRLHESVKCQKGIRVLQRPLSLRK